MSKRKSPSADNNASSKKQKIKALYRQPNARFPPGFYDGMETHIAFIKECIDAFRSVNFEKVLALQKNHLYSHQYLERIYTFLGQTLLNVAFQHATTEPKVRELHRIIMELPWTDFYLKHCDVVIEVAKENSHFNIFDNKEELQYNSTTHVFPNYREGCYNIFLHFSKHFGNKSRIAPVFKNILDRLHKAGYVCRSIHVEHLEKLWLYNTTNYTEVNVDHEIISTLPVSQLFPQYPFSDLITEMPRFSVDYPITQKAEKTYEFRFQLDANGPQTLEPTLMSYKQFFTMLKELNIDRPNILFHINNPAAYCWLQEHDGQNILTAKMENGDTILHILVSRLFEVDYVSYNYSFLAIPNIYRLSAGQFIDYTIHVRPDAWRWIIKCLEMGADVSVRNAKGQLPWDYVKYEIIRYGTNHYRKDTHIIDHHVGQLQNVERHKACWYETHGMAAMANAQLIVYCILDLLPRDEMYVVKEVIETFSETNPTLVQKGLREVFYWNCLAKYCTKYELWKNKDLNVKLAKWASDVSFQTYIGPQTITEVCKDFISIKSFIYGIIGKHKYVINQFLYCRFLCTMHDVYAEAVYLEINKAPEETKKYLSDLQKNNFEAICSYKTFAYKRAYQYFALQSYGLNVNTAIYIKKSLCAKMIVAYRELPDVKEEEIQAITKEMNQLEQQLEKDSHYSTASKVWENNSISAMVLEYAGY